MKRVTKKSLCAVLVAALLLSGVSMPGVAEAKKAKVKISKKKLTLKVGQKKKLKVKGTKKKVKWSSNKKKIATVSKKGVVKAKKKGTAKITAKVGKKKLTCKVTVKAKGATAGPKPTVKPTSGTGGNTPETSSNPNSTSGPGGSKTPGSSNTPSTGGDSPLPGDSSSPGTSSSPNGSSTPGTSSSPGASGQPSPGTSAGPNNTATPTPDFTAEPSNEDSDKTPGLISLSSGEREWNSYHKNLGQVTVKKGTTITISYNGIADGSLDWTNTYGTAIPMEALKSYEDQEVGVGFWRHHCKNGDVIELDEEAPVNTIYVRLKDLDKETYYYINTDNIIFEAPEESPSPAPAPTGSTSPTPTPTPQVPVTGNVGTETDLHGETAFTVVGSGNRTYKLALGLSASEVNTVLGTLNSDEKRTEKSPQGFDVIAFRQDGGVASTVERDKKYETYILLYLKDGKVIGITAIAPSMSYGSINADTLSFSTKPSGWNGVSWYKNNTAYTKDEGNAHVIAYADYLGDKKTYCLQMFSKNYSVEEMTDPNQVQAGSLNYTAEVKEAMALETGELINAYLVKTGVRALIINTNLSIVAKTYSKSIADSRNTNPSGHTTAQEIYNYIYGIPVTSDGRSAKIKVSGAWSEHILNLNIDSIGFANAVVESTEARKKIRNIDDHDYSIMGLGADGFTDGSMCFTNVVMFFANRITYEY